MGPGKRQALSFPIQLRNLLRATFTSPRALPYVQGQQAALQHFWLVSTTKQGEVLVTCMLSVTSLSTSPAANLLAHNDVQLVLHLSMDTGRDGGRQLVRGALEGADELPKLVQQRVPHLLLSYLLVLQVSLQLLDICNKQRGRCLCHLYLWR